MSVGFDLWSRFVAVAHEWRKRHDSGGSDVAEMDVAITILPPGEPTVRVRIERFGLPPHKVVANIRPRELKAEFALVVTFSEFVGHDSLATTESDEVYHAIRHDGLVTAYVDGRGEMWSSDADLLEYVYRCTLTRVDALSPPPRLEG